MTIHHQIEKLQKMVNNLLGLFGTNKPEAVQEEATLHPEDSRYERLGVMFLQAQDGVLEERYLLRMEKWLLCDKAALRYYVDFQSLTALLYMHFKPDRFGRNLLSKQIFAAQ